MKQGEGSLLTLPIRARLGLAFGSTTFLSESVRPALTPIEALFRSPYRLHSDLKSIRNVEKVTLNVFKLQHSWVIAMLT